MRRPAMLWMLPVVLVLASTLEALAQNETDVLRYSWVDPLGSSRTMGLGGAFGALGADLGSMGVNPAGLGMYRRGDLAMTCGVLGSGTTSRWDFRQEGAMAYAVTASNVGIALTYPSVDADMPFFTLAVGRQIRMPFAQRIRVDGVQSTETVSEVFVAQAIEDALEWGYVSTDEALANGDIFSHGAALAWQAGVLLPDNDNLYASAVDGPVQVTRLIEREGRMSETQIAFGSGFQEWFYFGATLGLPKVSFDERSTHTEAATRNESDLRSWTYQEDLAVNGRGWLLRGGVLFRISEALRVGLAHQTKARLTLLDTYATDVTASWMDGSGTSASSPTSNYEYIVQTPSRTTASASFLMGKVGVLNADYERSNVATGTLQDSDGFLSSGYDFAAENDAVAQAYQTSHAARVGLEIRAGDQSQWRIRGGGGMATSPFQGDAIVADATRYHASIGGGLRLGNVHLSAAWRTAWHQEDYYFMGALSSSAPGMLDRRSSILVCGAGLRM